MSICGRTYGIIQSIAGWVEGHEATAFPMLIRTQTSTLELWRAIANHFLLKGDHWDLNPQLSHDRQITHALSPQYSLLMDCHCGQTTPNCYIILGYRQNWPVTGMRKRVYGCSLANVLCVGTWCHQRHVLWSSITFIVMQRAKLLYVVCLDLHNELM